MTTEIVTENDAERMLMPMDRYEWGVAQAAPPSREWWRRLAANLDEWAATAAGYNRLNQAAIYDERSADCRRRAAGTVTRAPSPTDDYLPDEPMKLRCAERLADEVAVLVRRKALDSRSPAADALLDYRDPPTTERADRMAELEAECERLRKVAEEACGGWSQFLDADLTGDRDDLARIEEIRASLRRPPEADRG